LNKTFIMSIDHSTIIQTLNICKNKSQSIVSQKVQFVSLPDPNYHPFGVK